MSGLSVIAELQKTAVLIWGSWRKPVSVWKWMLPLFVCGLSGRLAVVILHLNTMNYVAGMSKHKGLDGLDVLPDLGHEEIGFQDIPMWLLDCCAGLPLLFFFAFMLLTRDLHVWTRAFTTSALLFALKAAFDYITVVPDSRGWLSCQAALQPNVISYFQDLSRLSGAKFTSKFMDMEVFGVPDSDGKRTQARFCADMMLSGHTSSLVTFLLGSLELIHKHVNAFVPTYGLVITVIADVVVVAFIIGEAYLIISNRFHYTVDVALAVLLALLIYTHHSLSIFAQWHMELGQPSSPREAVLWIPRLLFPFSGFSGFYRAAAGLEGPTRRKLEGGLPNYGAAGLEA